MNKDNSIWFSCIISGILILVTILTRDVLFNMLFVLFFSISFGIFLISFFLNKDRRLDIIILLILACECFYFPIGNIVPQDLMIIFIILLNAKMVMFNKKTKTDKNYKVVIFSLLLISFASALNATIEFSQSYINSVLPFRHYLILLAFFPVVDWMKRGYKVDKYLVIISFFSFSIFILQYVLFSKVQFLNIPHVSERIGAYRLHFQIFTPILGAMIAFNNFMILKKGLYRWFSLLVYLTGLIFTIFVNQTRSYMFGLIITAILIFVFSNINIKTKAKVIITLTFILLILSPLYISSIWQLLYSSFDEVTTSSGNYGVRQESIKYYLDLGKEHSIFGNGLINLRITSEALLPGLSRGLYWVDVGIYGLFYLHGLIGVTWYFLVFYILTKDFKNIIRKNYSYLLGYAVFGLFTLNTLGPFYFFLFPTVYCIATSQFVNLEKATVK